MAAGGGHRRAVPQALGGSLLSRLRTWRARAAALLRSRRRLDHELDDEIASHLAEAAAEHVTRGLTAEDARLAALREFGGVTQAKERYRQVRSFSWLGDLSHDLRYAIRSLAAAPAFSLIVISTLALGIGANAAIFSILNGLLLRSLPVREPGRLVHVTDSVLRDTGETRVRAWSYPVWDQLRRRPELFDGSTAWSFARFDLAAGGEAQFVDGVFADGGFFEVLGIPAALGRTFSPADDRRGGGPDGPVAVISHRHWQRQFGGDLDVIGRSIRLDGVAFTIVGITPPGFFGLEVGRAFDVVVPLQSEPLVRGADSALDSASTNFLSIIALLKPGQPVEAAAADLRRAQADIRAATLDPEIADAAGRYLTSPFTAVPAAGGFSYLREGYARPVRLLAAIVAVVLFIGCLNVASLLLARASHRQHEVTVRLALGASRLRLARQLFAESLFLAAAGAGVAMVIAFYGSRLLVQQLSTPTRAVVLDAPIDGTVLAFTAAVAVLTAVLFGTAPAFRATRVAPVDALKARGALPGGGGLVDWLVVVQVALSLVLTVAAALFARSFVGLTNRPLGLEPDKVLVVTVDGQRATDDPAQRLAFYLQARDAVRAVPDVADAAISFLTPMQGGGFTPPLEIAPAGAGGQPVRVSPDAPVFGNLVSRGWFRTLGTRLVAGRDIAERDRRGAPRVIVVNETFARRVLGSGDAMGRTVTVWPGTPRAIAAQVVGIVGDAVYSSPHETAPPTWYLPVEQFDMPGFPFESVQLSVRVEAGSPGRVRPAVVAALGAVSPRLTLTVQPLSERVRERLTRERVMAQLAGSLGALALLVAAIGISGIAGRALAQRRTEMAIRVALGALPTAVVAWVLRRVCLLVGAGVVAGAAASVWSARFAEGLVFGIPPREPATLAAAAAILCAIGLLAVWLPARRASRLDPMQVLREG